MKQVPVFLMSFVLFTNFAFASKTSRDPSVLDLTNLSRCEKQVTQAYRSQFPAISNAAIAAGWGTAYGVFVFGAGNGSIVLADSAVSSTGLIGSFGGVQAGEFPGDGTYYKRRVLISAVATGVVVAAISYGMAYRDYRATVDRPESVSQFFKDVNNNGMGPQIEVRASAITAALQKVSFVDQNVNLLKGVGPYNSATYSKDNVIDTLIQVGSEVATGTNVDCSDIPVLSERIDSATMRLLIEKYNPGLKAR